MISTHRKHVLCKTRPLMTFALLSTGLLFHSVSNADITAVFNLEEEQQLVLQYRDDNHVRMNVPGEGYMLITGGEGYMVSPSGNGWTVISIKDMATMISAIGAQYGATSNVSFMDFNENVEIRNTGRRETVAGLPGDVYEAIQIESDGTRETMEMVMSDHRDAKDAFQGFMRISTLMGEMAGIQGLDKLVDDAYGLGDKAVLRAGDEWVLASINRNSIPESDFALPAAPMAMPSIPGFGGAAAGDSSSSGGFGASISNWLGGEASNAGQVAADEAETIADETVQETRNEINNGIREGVRRGLRGLFD